MNFGENQFLWYLFLIWDRHVSDAKKLLRGVATEDLSLLKLKRVCTKSDEHTLPGHS